jgi:hypothetical protein
VAKVHQVVAHVKQDEAQVDSSKHAQGTLGESAMISVGPGNLIHTEVCCLSDTEDNHQERPDQESGRGLGHTHKLATEDHIIDKTVEMLGEDINQGGPEKESSSRDLGHIAMLATEDHAVENIMEKTTEPIEDAAEHKIAGGVDAAKD